jgi:sulfur-carrier protein
MKGFSVAIPTQLRSYTAGAAHVRVAVAAALPTLAEVLAALDAAYPGIRFRMVDEAGHVRPHIQIFVDGKVERNPAATVRPNANIMIVGALSGG